MHQGIGLDRFNAMPRSRAVHALYGCCGSVTWAWAIADARPFATQHELVVLAQAELDALSPIDRERALDGHPHTAAELARMLGPVDGYPEY